MSAIPGPRPALETNDAGERQCTACQRMLPESAYYRPTAYRAIYRRCRECWREINRQGAARRKEREAKHGPFKLHVRAARRQGKGFVRCNLLALPHPEWAATAGIDCGALVFDTGEDRRRHLKEVHGLGEPSPELASTSFGSVPPVKDDEWAV
jgi:hypothetical protein